MPTFAVRFKGMLTKIDRERLERAGTPVVESEPSMRIGLVKTGRPIHTVHVEADSPEQAREALKETLAEDSASFSGYEAKPL